MNSKQVNWPQGKTNVVAVVALKAIGHMQMLLPVVKELLHRGTEVHMFLDDLGQEKAEAAVKCLLDLGLKRYPLMSHISDESTDIVEVLKGKYMPLVKANSNIEDAMITKTLGFFMMNLDMLPHLLQQLKQIKPDCILFDTCKSCGHFAGKIMDIPTIGWVSYPGPGCMDIEEELQKRVKTKDAWDFKKRMCEPIMEKYGLDIIAHTYESPGPPCYSDYLNIVTTIEELGQTKSTVHAVRLPTFKYLGPVSNADESLRLNATFTPKAKDEKEDENDHRVAHRDDIPWKAVTDAKLSGKKIVCLSFGTVITSLLWKKIAIEGEEEKGEEVEGKRLDLVGGANDGKEFCQRLWKHLFEAFGDDPNMLFIASIGKQEDALEGEGLKVPSNFIIRHQIPQLKCLSHADAFITHGGWNSLQESIQHGVPMLVLPGFGDQPMNARKVSETGAGIGIDEPYLNASVHVLKTSLNKLLHEGSYKATAEALGKKLVESNGLKQAADLILSSINSRAS